MTNFDGVSYDLTASLTAFNTTALSLTLPAAMAGFYNFSYRVVGVGDSVNSRTSLMFDAWERLYQFEYIALITKVTPAIANARGGDLITVWGRYWPLSHDTATGSEIPNIRTQNVSALVGDVACVIEQYYSDLLSSNLTCRMQRYERGYPYVGPHIGVRGCEGTSIFRSDRQLGSQ